jgi:hypothetical protein
VFLLAFIITLNVIQYYISLVVFTVEITLDLVKCGLTSCKLPVRVPPPPFSLFLLR